MNKFTRRQALLAGFYGTVLPCVMGSAKGMYAPSGAAAPLHDDDGYWNHLSVQYDSCESYFDLTPGTPSIKIVREAYSLALERLVAVKDLGQCHLAAKLRAKAAVSQYLEVEERTLSFWSHHQQAMGHIASEVAKAIPSGKVILSGFDSFSAQEAFLHASGAAQICRLDYDDTPGRPTEDILGAYTREMDRQAGLGSVFVTMSSSRAAAALPARELLMAAKRRGLLTVLDASDALGVVSLDDLLLHCDYAILDLSRWLGVPQGVSVVYGADGLGRSDLNEPSGDVDISSVASMESVCAAIDFSKLVTIRAIEERRRFLADSFRQRLEHCPRVITRPPLTSDGAPGSIAFRVGEFDQSDIAERLLESGRILVNVAESTTGTKYLGVDLKPYVTLSDIDRIVRNLLSIS